MRRTVTSNRAGLRVGYCSARVARWMKLLAIYIIGYLDGEKLSQRLVFRTFVGALVNLFIEIVFLCIGNCKFLCKKAECMIHKMSNFPSDSGYT